MNHRKERSFDEHYNKLTGDQLLNVYACQSVGFVLWFVRVVDENIRIAILKQGENLISIDPNGDIQEELDIELRNAV